MKTIILGGVFLFSFFFSSYIHAQERNGAIKSHFLLEDNIAVANTDGEFFPVFNNEFSVCYGINNALGAGLFYDLYSFSRLYHNNYVKGNSQLFGVKILFSVVPVLGENWQARLQRFNLNVNAYFSHNADTMVSYNFLEKKDKQTWVNYYRLNVEYFLSPKIYLSANAGLVNSDRFLLGLGLKL